MRIDYKSNKYINIYKDLKKKKIEVLIASVGTGNFLLIAPSQAKGKFMYSMKP